MECFFSNEKRSPRDYQQIYSTCVQVRKQFRLCTRDVLRALAGAGSVGTLERIYVHAGALYAKDHRGCKRDAGGSGQGGRLESLGRKQDPGCGV